jgi:hypothetical protein
LAAFDGFAAFYTARREHVVARLRSLLADVPAG